MGKVAIYPMGLQYAAWNTSPDGVSGPGYRMGDRDSGNLWLPAGQTVQFDIQVKDRFGDPLAIQATDWILINNLCLDAGCAVEGCGIKLWTSTGDDQAGTGTREDLIGTLTVYHNASQYDQPTWNEYFPLSNSRVWWHCIIRGSAADWTYNQAGVMLISKLYSINALPYSRPRKVPIVYGIDRQVAPSGNSSSVLLWGKKYQWAARWGLLTGVLSEEFGEIWDHIEGGLWPFYLQDTDGVGHWVKATMKGEMPRSENKRQRWQVEFNFATEF